MTDHIDPTGGHLGDLEPARTADPGGLREAATKTERLVRQYVMLFGGKGRDERTILRSLDALRAALASETAAPAPDPMDACIVCGGPVEGTTDTCRRCTTLYGPARSIPDDALRTAVSEMFTDPVTGKPSSGWYCTNEVAAKLRAALATAPEPTPLHPDDGHDHRFTCVRCGVDTAPDPGGLREAVCGRTDAHAHHKEEGTMLGAYYRLDCPGLASETTAP